MKKVITMVGTSIFENYFEENGDSTVRNFYDTLKKRKNNEWNNEMERIQRLRKSILNWTNEKQLNKGNLSAEIKSLVKLKEELKDEIEIYLLHSDTILSKLAAEIIEEVVPTVRDLEDLKAEIRGISSLQIWDRRQFNHGMANLINEIYTIAGEYWDNVVINITGGYKAIIPYLTILGQINRCPIYYIFEETDSLIKIPNIPLAKEWLDWAQIGEYEEILMKLDKGITDENEYYKIRNSEFYKQYSFLLWEEKPFAELNPIGKIIYQKYREKFFKFLVTPEVICAIENDRNLKNIFSGQFSNAIGRQNKTESKNGHLVYDAGNNQLRIFYREKEGEICVYKCFNNHDEYERYLNSTPFNETLLCGDFKAYKIKKEV